MEKYLEEMGIVHHHTTPLWPRANGEVEREKRPLLKAMRVFQAEGKTWRAEPQSTRSCWPTDRPTTPPQE